MKIDSYPKWAEKMRSVYRSGMINQFILHGNIHDTIISQSENEIKEYSLLEYLSEVLYQPFQVVIHFNLGNGIKILKGEKEFHGFLSAIDKYRGTKFSAESNINASMGKTEISADFLPRDPASALHLIDLFMRATKNNAESSLAVIIDYASFLLPRGPSLNLQDKETYALIKILNWAENSIDQNSKAVVTLIGENLLDLNDLITNSPYNSKIRIDLPIQPEIKSYLDFLISKTADFEKYCAYSSEILSQKLVGLTRISIRTILYTAIKNQIQIDDSFLARHRKESIEKESLGKIVFLESDRTLDDVAGHNKAKEWLREDAELLRQAKNSILPMGYLLSGRIGTGKTYLVQCFAGECGIPFVELKNFRDKWVGSSEGNLEKIFQILHALGQVVVFIDEADQSAGKRNGGDGDSGLSGRIYAMLAKEMSNTKNRGKILWIFATSRPDLLEVDLKRQGRLDIHIPLFPPQNEAELQELFLAMIKKNGLAITLKDLPKLEFSDPLGGNEIEGLLIRATRSFHLLNRDPTKKQITFKKIMSDLIKEFKPSAHQTKMEYMDLVAVKECTDARFLSEKYSKMPIEQVDERIQHLQQNYGF